MQGSGQSVFEKHDLASDWQNPKHSPEQQPLSAPSVHSAPLGLQMQLPFSHVRPPVQGTPQGRPQPSSPHNLPAQLPIQGGGEA